MSIKDVADYLEVDYKTVYRLVRNKEIPASQVGRVYRIRPADVDAYLARQRLGAEAAPATAAVRKCGMCMRLLHDEGEIGGYCRTEGCNEPICTTCWTRDGHTTCEVHRPSQSDQLAEAQAALDRGDIPLLVTAVQARRREQAYITRFDAKVEGITRLLHPIRESVVDAPDDWAAVHETEDEAVKLMRLMRTGFIGADVERRMPLNRSSRYRMPGQGRKETGLIFEARIFAHLPALVEKGYDTAPATVEEATQLLDEAVERASQAQTGWLLGLASPTGWSEEAESYVASGEAGRTFYDRRVMPYLVDLERIGIIYNESDERLPPMAPLFAPLLLAEGVAQVRAYVARALATSARVGVSEIMRDTGLDAATVGQALTQMVEAGTHVLDEDPALGQVVRATR
jgi:excisionase family DNA binding protein